jgi:hypothetical protein
VVKVHDVLRLLPPPGSAASITTETTGATRMADACLVNWIWLTGVIDLVSG